MFVGRGCVCKLSLDTSHKAATSGGVETATREPARGWRLCVCVEIETPAPKRRGSSMRVPLPVYGLVPVASATVAAIAATAAATAAAEAAASTTTAAATISAAAATTTAARAIFAGAGFVDGESASAVLLAVQRRN